MKARLKDAVKEAMKVKDKLRLETLRSVLSALQYEEMRKKVDELSEEAVIAILKNEVKKRRESLTFAEKGERKEMCEQLHSEIAILEEFLPQQLSTAELEKIIGDFQQEQPEANMGLAMKMLKDSYNGQYDGKQASEIAKKLFG